MWGIIIPVSVRDIISVGDVISTRGIVSSRFASRPVGQYCSRPVEADLFSSKDCFTPLVSFKRACGTSEL